MERSNLNKEKYKMHSLRRKGTLENLILEPSLVLKMRLFKKSLEGHRRREREGGMGGGEAIVGIQSE